MDVQKLQNIIAEYGETKIIKIIHYQNGGTESRAMKWRRKEQLTN